MPLIPPPASKVTHHPVQRPLTITRDLNLPNRISGTKRTNLRKDSPVGRHALLALVACGLVLALAVVLANPRGTPQAQANRGLNASPIAQGLVLHHTAALAGDYLQIHAIRQTYKQTLYLRPTLGCGTIVSSPPHGFHTVSYAVLFTKTRFSGGTYGCTLAELLNRYGKPTGRLDVSSSGSLSSSTLLFYDGPRHILVAKRKLSSITPPPAAVVPITPVTPVLPPPPVPALQDLAGTQCPAQSIMNIVAHQDDDLFFMNPDTANDIRAGNCIRSVYLTAGDDGRGGYYWQSRQKGVEAAYDVMLGSNSGWLQRKVNIGEGRYATVASPYGKLRISLVFLALPDGNLAADGFPSTGHASLTRLLNGSIAGMTSLSYRSTYSSSQLVTALANIINTYHPAILRTQADDSTADVTDHSDHIAAGRYAAAALAASANPAAAIAYYQGYPIRTLPANLSDGDTAAKAAAFAAYARYDSEACKTMESCTAMGSSYSQYLSRQYRN